MTDQEDEENADDGPERPPARCYAYCRFSDGIVTTMPVLAEDQAMPAGSIADRAPNAPRARAVSYARLAAADPDVLASQRAACRAYAERNGYEIVAEFCDDGYSGSSLSVPGLDALCEFVAPGDVVIAVCPERIGRGLEVHLALKKKLEQKESTIVYSCDEKSDSHRELSAQLLATAAGEHEDAEPPEAGSGEPYSAGSEASRPGRDRPSLAGLLGFVCPGHTIITYSAVRLARSYEHYVRIEGEIKQRGIKINCVTTPINDPAGRTFLHSLSRLLGSANRRQSPSAASKE